MQIFKKEQAVAFPLVVWSLSGFDTVLLRVLHKLVLLYVEASKVHVVASSNDLACDPTDEISVNAVPLG
jgi:hypothetical protein